MMSQLKQGNEIMKIITGKGIGGFRLRALISACELEAQGLTRRGSSALSILKRELGVKGSRETVLTAAREMLANVANW